MIEFWVWIDRPYEEDYYGIVEAENAQACIAKVRAKLGGRVFPIVQPVDEAAYECTF